MRKRVALVILLLTILVTTYLARAQVIYPNHEAAATAAVGEVLETFGGQLPKRDVELTMLDRTDPAVPLYDVADWQVETVKLRNTVSLQDMVLDDDPIYGLRVDLRVRFEDGSEADLAWESWRYGIVVGPIVIGHGDGPPGWFAIASTPVYDE